MEDTVNKSRREVELYAWDYENDFPCRVVENYRHGDDPRTYIIALGNKDKDVALVELQEIVSSWRCNCAHDCCAHRFALGGRIMQLHGKTFAIIRTDINV